MVRLKKHNFVMLFLSRNEAFLKNLFLKIIWSASFKEMEFHEVLRFECFNPLYYYNFVCVCVNDNHLYIVCWFFMTSILHTNPWFVEIHYKVLLLKIVDIKIYKTCARWAFFVLSCYIRAHEIWTQSIPVRIFFHNDTQNNI